MSKVIALFAFLATTSLSGTTTSNGIPQDLDLDPESLRGTVIAARDVVIRAAETGPLAELAVSEGDDVAAGALLGRVDDRLARAGLAAAEAATLRRGDIASAQSDVAAAKVRVERFEKTARQGAAPRAELDDARFALRKAEAVLQSVHDECERLARQRDLEAVRVERHLVRAPFAGRVVRIHAQAGAMMNVDEDMLRLVDLRTLHAELHLPVALFPHLKVGQVQRLKAEAPFDRILAAEVVTVDPIFDSATHTFRAVLAIDNSSQELPVGFVVHLVLPQN